MMIPSSAPAEADLVEKIAEFVDDPLGFVMFAYPWKERGPLEQYDGPDVWQRELLEDIGREVRKRGFDGLNAVLPIRQAISSGHGIGKSTASAWITNWILSTRPSSQGTVTANTFPQVDASCHHVALVRVRHAEDLRSKPTDGHLPEGQPGRVGSLERPG